MERAATESPFPVEESGTAKESTVAVNSAHTPILNNLQVKNLSDSLPALINYFELKTRKFKAGQISHKLTEWQKVTSDTEILSTVAGEKIEFTSLPQQITVELEINSMNRKMLKLLKQLNSY